jgi:putative ABC transport system permease protein
MQLLSHLRFAFFNLLSAKVRSFLAILGITVGTGAVVALMGSSKIATTHALAQFKQLGTNLIALHISDNQTTNKLPDGLIQALTTPSKTIESAAPYVSWQGETKDLANIDRRYVGLFGTTNLMQSIAKFQLSSGRFISFLDRSQRFCVVGSRIAQSYRQRFLNPIGAVIGIDGHLFTIIGVIKPWESSLFLPINANESIITTLPALTRLYPNTSAHDLLFRLKTTASITEAEADIRSRVQRFMPESRLLFRNPGQIIAMVSKERKTLDNLLLSIGAIALVVGGIGVMNIMLVSVVERRREIGIRMAIGAKQADIITMFLIESVLLTLFGGGLGVLVGLLATLLFAHIAGWTFVWYLTPVLLGFSVSVCIGMISGIYPAWQAAKLDPIVCLSE